MRTRYNNSILLSAIGDSLGWITEFERNTNRISSKYGTDFIDKFYDWEKNVGGRFNGYTDRIISGSYSDDTQLLLSVARSIKANGEIDNNYFSKIELPTWLKYSRGAGRTIKNAANKISRKSASWNNNFFKFKIDEQIVDYRECGANGAAMRILPIVLANRGNNKKIKEDIFSNTISTHGHPRAIVGAILYGYAINSMLSQKNLEFNYQAFLTDIGLDIEQKFRLDFLTKSVYKDWLLQWNQFQFTDFNKVYEDTIRETLAFLRKTYINLRDNKTTHEALKDLGCFDASTKGSGISTVIAGIYLVCRFHQDPEKTITEAVNSIGSDTDSIAAFAGGLVGSLYERPIVPEKWTNVQDSDYLIKTSDRLFNISESQNRKISSDVSSLYPKSLTEISTDNFEVEGKFIFEPLGEGKIMNIDRQKTLTKGKYNLILDVKFEIGQSCRFAKLLDIKRNDAEDFFLTT